MNKATVAALSARRRDRLVIGLFTLVAGAVAWWTWRALRDGRAFDFRLYYRAGQVAAATGHPERVPTWDGTPLLAAVMALVSRLLSLRVGAALITLLSAGLTVGAVGVTLRRLRGTVGTGVLALLGAGLLTFAPLLSTVWWKQFNVIVLVAAIGAYALLVRGRSWPAAALLALSISLKPLLVLLPLVLLVRADTRRTGALTVGFVAALNLAGQVVLALCAGRLGPLDPLVAVNNFLTKSRAGNVWACERVNFAPGSLVCRVLGPGQLGLVHVAVLTIVVLGAIGLARWRGVGAGPSWDLFAFTCLLSVMLSPLAWAHYQVVLAPLFVLLAVRLAQAGAGAGWWLALGSAFVLCSLLWLPYGTLPDDLQHLLTGYRLPPADSFSDENFLAQFAQFAQYVLLATGLFWCRRHAGPSARVCPAAQTRRSAAQPTATARL